MTIIGVRIDLHCDDECDMDSTATVVNDDDGTVLLERDCCHAEVEMSPTDFNEYLRD